MKPCFKCQTELEHYDSDTNRWFEASGKPHHCEKIALYSDQDQKGRMGFFAHVRPEMIAKNITDAIERNHWQHDRVVTEVMGDFVIVRPR